MKCKQCGREFHVPAITAAQHYSSPPEICFACEIYNLKRPGDYYQLPNGEYVKK